MELRSSCFSITFLDAVEQNGADWPCEHAQATPHVVVTRKTELGILEGEYEGCSLAQQINAAHPKTTSRMKSHR